MTDLAELFQFAFFRNALWAILIISVACGMLGCYIVVRRLVFIAGGITHASFGGLGLGFFLGISPSLSALLFAAGSAFGVEWVSRKRLVREDSAIAAVWSLGMAVGIIFVFLTPGYTPGLTQFLFGNILTVTQGDIGLFLLFTGALALFLGLFYREILYTAFDRDFARTQQIPVRFIEYALMLFIATGIVLAIRLIGVMLMISLLTIPQNTALLLGGSLKRTMALSALFSVAGGMGGLLLSLALNVPASACIVFSIILLFAGVKAGIFLRNRLVS